VISVLLPLDVSSMNVRTCVGCADLAFIDFRFKCAFESFFLQSFIDMGFKMLVLRILDSVLVFIKFQVSFLCVVNL
jgi:hypothetical protein